MDETMLSVETVEQDSVTHAYRLKLTGELDLDSAPVLTAEFDRRLAEGATLIVVDATNVEFMDSTGLRAIVAAGNSLSAVGGQLLIEGVSGAAKRVLEISGLLDHYRRD